jgi:hypothetical protein
VERNRLYATEKLHASGGMLEREVLWDPRTNLPAVVREGVPQDLPP